jgi:class 3 adenylate cyclase
MIYAKQALELSENTGNKIMSGNVYNLIGVMSVNKGDYASSLEYFNNFLKISEELGNKKGIESSYINIGSVYYYLGNYPEALKYKLKALKIQEEIGEKRDMGLMYSDIGFLDIKLANYSDALPNLQAALKIFEELADKSGTALVYNNFATFYYAQGNFPEALKYNYAALKLKEELGNLNDLADTYNNIGYVYMDMGNYEEARKNLFASLKIHDELGDKGALTQANINIGRLYTIQKKYYDASKYLAKGLSLAEEIGFTEQIAEGNYRLALLDSAQGNYKQAFEHYKIYIGARDSVVNQENTKKITQQQMQFEFDKRDALAKAEQEKKDALAQKELQRQKVARNGFMSGFAVVLLFAGVFLVQRNKIRKGKKLSDKLLLNILPEEVAEELKAKGSADSKLIDNVTVLFTDFKGFTQLAEKLSPTELVSEINECFSAFDHIMLKHNVEKIKTIGDSYMAAGGLPTPNNTHAGDVVEAALEIQQYMLDYRAKREQAGDLFFEMRIGIHTGPVVAGIVGVKKFAYDIWGDTVNIASRMESSGEPGKVNISGATYTLVNDKFNCTHRGKIQAKNKGEIDMYFVEII